MKTDELDEIDWQPSVETGGTRWSGFDRDIQQSDGNQHCFYCNFSLKCGQLECIWREYFA